MKGRKHRLGWEGDRGEKKGAKSKSSFVMESQHIISKSEQTRNRNTNQAFRDIQVKTKDIS